jgi:hypothetical protein
MFTIIKAFPRLTESNFNDWLIDIRAHLRTHKLWHYTQSFYLKASDENDDSVRAIWEEKSMKAADRMTLIITNFIKQKLRAKKFNDGYVMLNRLTALLQLIDETQFLRLTRELYTLQYSDFKDVSEFLTRVKVLKEQVAATKVEMTDDKRTLLTLTMVLWNESRYRFLLQIWNITLNMTAERARAMLMEEERREVVDERLNFTRGSGSRSKEIFKCSYCKKDGHKKETCWKLHPELIPDKYKDGMEGPTKGLNIIC